MSTERAEALLYAVNAQQGQLGEPLEKLLRAIVQAWFEAEHGIPSEVESRRWGRVCEFAERAVGL